jgi:hypothetical protein
VGSTRFFVAAPPRHKSCGATDGVAARRQGRWRLLELRQPVVAILRANCPSTPGAKPLPRPPTTSSASAGRVASATHAGPLEDGRESRGQALPSSTAGRRSRCACRGRLPRAETQTDSAQGRRAATMIAGGAAAGGGDAGASPRWASRRHAARHVPAAGRPAYLIISSPVARRSTPPPGRQACRAY